MKGIYDFIFVFSVATDEHTQMIRPLADVEKELILDAIIVTGSIAKAAIKLRIGRPRIYRLLKNEGIELKISEITKQVKKQRKLFNG